VQTDLVKNLCYKMALHIVNLVPRASLFNVQLTRSRLAKLLLNLASSLCADKIFRCGSLSIFSRRSSQTKTVYVVVNMHVSIAVRRKRINRGIV